MNIDQINTVLNHLDDAQKIIRDELAATNDADCTLRQNEIALECVIKDFTKRFSNARELLAREFASRRPDQPTETAAK